MLGLLEVGPLIEARLRAAATLAPEAVFSTADLAGVKEASQITPARHVVLHSYEPISNVGADRRWRETYLVVTVVRNARQGVGAQAVRDEASPIHAETLALLDNWKPPGALTPLEVVGPISPEITKAFGYFPLAFVVEVATQGMPDTD